jgi:hypothetical protein
VWVVGIALVQLLVIEIDAVLLWPTPCEAERKAVSIREGMTSKEVDKLAGTTRFGPYYVIEDRYIWPTLLHWEYEHGSRLVVALESGQVASIRTTPPTPIPPLTHLRRTLARVFPALKE